MFEEARARLSAAGYHAYEVSNFARAGCESRHNLAYWRADPYLGIGAGAHSWHANGPRGHRLANVEEPGRYMALALTTGGAAASEEEIDQRRAAGEFIFLNLRRTEGFATGRFRDRFGIGFRDAWPHVDTLFSDGLLDEADEHIRLTRRGLLLADSIFAGFL